MPPITNRDGRCVRAVGAPGGFRARLIGGGRRLALVLAYLSALVLSPLLPMSAQSASDLQTSGAGALQTNGASALQISGVGALTPPTVDAPSSPGGEDDVLVLDDKTVQTPKSLLGHMSALDDADGRLIIDDIVNGPAARQFQRLPGNLNRGYTPHHTWVRIHFRRQHATGAPDGEGDARWFVQLGPLYLDHVDVYSATPGLGGPSRLRHWVYGDSEDRSRRPYAGREFLVPLDFAGGDTLTLYIHLHTTSSTALEGVVGDQFVMMHKLSTQSFWLGIYLGIAVAALLANLLYGGWLREKSSLAYCAYIFCLIGVTLGADNLLVDVLPSWASDIANLVHTCSLFLAVITAAIMCNTMMNLRVSFPHVHRVTWGCSIIPGAIGVVAAATGHFQMVAPLINAISVCVLALVSGCGLTLAWRGNRVAQLMCVAFAPSVFASSATMLRTLNLLPFYPEIDQGVMAAGALHLILMNVAIAYRVRVLEADRQAALAAALSASQNAGRQARELVRQRTRELAASNAQLSQALAAERQAIKEQIQFVDMVSHEYRTPVAILRTAIDVLALHTDTVLHGLPPNLLTRMRRAVERLVEIIEVGLRLDGPQSGALSMLAAPMDLAVTVRATVQAALSAHPQHTITLQAPDTLPMLGDPDLLKTALLNLLGNAVKYAASPNPIHVDVIPLMAHSGDHVRIRVTDDGPGIPSADQERVFQKFVRLSHGQRVPGTGLGLFMVRRIAELHGGRAYVDPSRTTGCRLVIDIPWQQPASIDSPGMKQR